RVVVFCNNQDAHDNVFLIQGWIGTAPNSAEPNLLDDLNELLDQAGRLNNLTQPTLGKYSSVMARK
ncbi:MAG: hypothetical protein ACO28I_10740, partial [Limnohabitans sp.]